MLPEPTHERPQSPFEPRDSRVIDLMCSEVVIGNPYGGALDRLPKWRVSMRNAAAGLLILLAVPLAAQAPTNLKKGDRPVFYSAGALAKDCRVGSTLLANGPLQPDNNYSLSMEQLASLGKCEGYIDGVMDARLDSYTHLWPNSRYNPIPSTLGYGPKLIDTFIKYVTDHPEEEDFAASTVLAKVEKIIGNAQGLQVPPSN